MDRLTLSVVIITKNEEDKISRCLESIRWADEIIVVDDLSQDRTVEIAQGYGAKVVSHRLQADFSQQRNIGIENANGNWILQLDADEVVPEGLKKEIQKVISENSGFSGFQFRRKNFFLGHFMRYGGFYGPYSLKLFKREQARYRGCVHEQLEIEGKTAAIDSDIEHYPITSITGFIEKLNFYTTIEAEQLFAEGGAQDSKSIRYNLTVRPLKTFWKMFIKRKGYKDGMFGFVFSLLFTFNQMLKWMKYWQLCERKDANS